MADVPWWGSLLTGVAGGLTALGGQLVAYVVTSKRDAAKRKAEAIAKAEADLKAAYVTYLHELRKKQGDLLHLISEQVDKHHMRVALSRHLMLDPSDAYFKLRMLERPEFALKVEQVGDADTELISMAVADECDNQQLSLLVAKALVTVHDFQEWVYKERFTP